MLLSFPFFLGLVLATLACYFSSFLIISVIYTHVQHSQNRRATPLKQQLRSEICDRLFSLLTEFLENDRAVTLSNFIEYCSLHFRDEGIWEIWIRENYTILQEVDTITTSDSPHLFASQTNNQITDWAHD